LKQEKVNSGKEKIMEILACFAVEMDRMRWRFSDFV
jgi:hypothetical protein